MRGLVARIHVLRRAIDVVDGRGHRMTTVDDTRTIAEATAPAESLWRHLRYHIARHPLGAVGAAIMAVFVFAAIFAPFLTHFDPVTTNSALSLAPPSAAHIFGCDFIDRKSVV